MPPEEKKDGSENAALLAAADDLWRSEKVEIALADGGTAHLSIMPRGRRVESLKPLLDQFLKAPERIKGTASIGDLGSFKDHVARFGVAGETAIFANPDAEAAGLTAVYDYSKPGAPGWHQHRAAYTCPMSEPWQAWMEKDAEPMTQTDFAAFLEDRIADVVVPDSAAQDAALSDFARLVGGTFATPQQLIELSRGLAIRADVRVKNAVNLSSGESTLQFEEAHNDIDGVPVKVPNFFLIVIPVFQAGATYRIPVRLRYRVSQGKIVWFYQLYRADRVFEDAFADVITAAKDTGYPVFVGAPES
jgi:uncharacterized protein YfdQ (DUF2303 family)